MNRLFNTLLCLAIPFLGWGQTVLSIGEWQSLFPFNGGQSVTEGFKNVYYSSPQGIVAFDKIERTSRTITKVDGLSSAEPAKLVFHKPTASLIAAYNSGVIDIITSDGVITMKDIANFDNIPIETQANHLQVMDERSILLSADFGVSRIDVINQKVLWTCFTPNNPVSATIKFGGDLYMATEDGLYTVPINGLIENFDSWTKLGEDEGLVEGLSYSALTQFNDALLVGSGPTIFYRRDSLFEVLLEEPGYEIRHLSTSYKYSMASFFCPGGCDSKVVSINRRWEFADSRDQCSNRVREAISDSLDWTWYADDWNKFRLAPGNGAACKFLEVNGPFTSNVNEIAVANNQLLVASGGTENGFGYSFRNDGFFILNESGKWSFRNQENVQELRDRDMKGFHRVAVHPETGDQFYATYWAGVVAYRADGSWDFYDQSNSALREKGSDDPRERCTDVTFDRENNLWVTSVLSPENRIAMLSADGEWYGFNPPQLGEYPSELVVDQNDLKWIVMGDNGQGVYVFDEGDPTTTADDRYQVFTSSNSELPSNNALSIAVDREGDVWVGTDQGAVVFECSIDDIFNGNCIGNRRKVEQDSILALLLETEEVLSIAVDGANRKWFGTRSGIYVQSPSGEDQEFSFDINNSPLPSNTILDIAIDGETGTAYIATDNGIMAYRTNATEGQRFHASEVVAYPNPVRPGYDGPIAIKGLPTNAQVRITDVSGYMIYETEALGGQAIWDGRDYNGVRAASGIYLVFSTSEGGTFEDPEAMVTKILIMN